MASSATVWVVDSSFKRTQVKVSPGQSLKEVLQEACRSRKWNAEEYMLKSQSGKVVDLSQPWRLSGLSAGAKLQLTQASRSPSVVSVALLLPEGAGGGEGGQRLQDKFASTTSLWLVLRKFEDGVAGSAQKLNLTQRGSSSLAGGLTYEQPCLHLLNRNYDTFTDLQKTLLQIGLNGGSVVIRLSFKDTQQPLEAAMQEIEVYFKSVHTVPAGIGSSAQQGAEGAHAGGANGTMESAPDASAENSAVPLEGEAKQEPNDDTPMSDGPTAPIVENDVIASSSETQPQPSQQDPPTTAINGITVYHPPSSSTPFAAQQPHDPSVFEPHIEHAKAHQAALTRSAQNKRLLSDKELDEADSARREKLATVQSVTVRVRYPDQSMIELIATSSETAADLYNRVMGTLAAAPEPFELKYTGAKGHETLPNNSTKRLVRDLGWRGRVLVTLVWSPEASVQARSGHSLKEEYRIQATDLKVELQSRQADGEAAHKEAMLRPEKKEAGGGKGKGDLEMKMKKFLGFGKK